ncbi:Pr6Pr family membrane protein [Arthrobacter sp. B10-11]|uniref:Pr6Pr family membrane protein n=1 Tax=Arthrobacter sp. B10-11 TaxID=3081160 RepID=UPI0029559987|nr:Pr6Pr family membrane protein [Arthrobacter sp. B10-11]MDV8146199.1 Pr6Pr family membrane protein [Arthrobacter sp. B10-11]
MSDVAILVPPIERHPGFNDALHPDRLWIRLLRFAVGVFVLAALVQKTYDATLPGSDVDIGQLYSEFTVQSNLVLGLVLVVSAARTRARLPEWWDHLLGALTFYLVMTGIIYAVLVAPPDEPWWSWDMYWPQLAHHRLAPLFIALDWLLVTKTVHGKWSRPLAWLSYPSAFLIYSWIRGGIDGWYVYDFLDPTLGGGWPAALMTTAQVLVAFLLIALLVHLGGNARAALAIRRKRR